jgi:hypothetical protein
MEELYLEICDWVSEAYVPREETIEEVHELVTRAVGITQYSTEVEEGTYDDHDRHFYPRCLHIEIEDYSRVSKADVLELIRIDERLCELF